MKTILLMGLGRYGLHVARCLADLEVEVLAIDQNEEKLRSISEYVTKTMIGKSTDMEFMKTIGVNNFDECIVAIGDDFQSSLETVLILKELGARKITARATKETQETILKKIGADQVVYPEKQLAKWTAMHCGTNSIFDYMEFEDGFAIYEIAVPKEWEGKTIVELNLRKLYNITIIALREKKKLKVVFGSDYVFKSDDVVLITGKQKDITKCFKL